MHELPLDLLFLEVEKVGHDRTSAEVADENNWMPLYPGQGLLEVKSKMVRIRPGYALEIDTDPEISLFLISSLSNSIRGFRLVSYAQYPDANADEYEKQYWIEDARVMASAQAEHEERDVYIIFRNAARTKCPGARLFVTRTNGDNIFVRYDCVLQVSQAKFLPSDLSPPSFRARMRPTDSVLVLEHSLLHLHSTPIQS